jgi:hypothetical protein
MTPNKETKTADRASLSRYLRDTPPQEKSNFFKAALKRAAAQQKEMVNSARPR